MQNNLMENGITFTSNIKDLARQAKLKDMFGLQIVIQYKKSNFRHYMIT